MPKFSVIADDPSCKAEGAAWGVSIRADQSLSRGRREEGETVNFDSFAALNEIRALSKTRPVGQRVGQRVGMFRADGAPMHLRTRTQP
jgi:hypothetical protein